MLRRRRKNGSILLSMLCVLLMETAQPLAVSTSAASAVLIEAESGRVLYEQNADEERLIASTTKIMTAVVALEACPLEDVVEVKPTHMAEGSSMYLRSGETLTLETLLYGLMLSSGNDAALAVADHCGPGVEAFVGKMNAKAAELGMEHTSFANPNGLDDPNHYSTARDMAILASYAMQNESFARIVSTKSITIGDRRMVNHNKLLSRYEGCIGLKTGFTKAAGRTLVSCAERDGMRLVAVTLNDGNDWLDHAALYDYGFSNFHMERPSLPTEQLILYGNQVKASVEGFDFAYPIKEGEKLRFEADMATYAVAPVLKGAVAGSARCFLNDSEIGASTLYYGESVAALPIRYTIK